MGKPFTDPVAHRRICRATLARYEGRDNRCVRDVLCWLLLGPDSTRIGLRYCRPVAIASELGWSVANIEGAIAQLAADGLLIHSPEVRTVLLHDALTCAPPANDSHRTSLRREADNFQACVAKAKAIELIGARPDTVSNTVRDTVPDTREQGTGNRELPAAQVSPAVADDAPRDDKQAGEQLSLTMSSSPAPRATEQAIKRRKDAEELQDIWNRCCANVHGWAPCSRLDGACRVVLGRAMANMRQNLPPNDDDPDLPIWQLLDFASNDPWWNGTKHNTWGILQFFAAHNLDKLIAEYNRKRSNNAA